MTEHLSGEYDGPTTVKVNETSYLAIASDFALGSVLASTGDSGKLHLWKQDLSMRFVEFAETGLVRNN